MRMTFGRYKDRLLDDVPEDYLLWCLDHCDRMNGFMRESIEQHLRCRDRQPGASQVPQATLARVRVDVLTVVAGWQRRQAMAHHPDRGGDVRVMQAVNDRADNLRRDRACVRVRGVRRPNAAPAGSAVASGAGTRQLTGKSLACGG